MIKQIKRLLNLESLSEKLDRLTVVSSELNQLNDQFDELVTNYTIANESRKELYKSVNSEGIYKAVESRFNVYQDNYLNDLKEVKRKRDKVNKEYQSLISEPDIEKSFKDLTEFNKIKQAYKSNLIKSEALDMFLKAKQGVVKYADNLVFNQDGLMLILKRSMYDETQAQMWVIPGGHVDLGEEFDEAAIRELQEESGLLVDKVEKVGEYIKEGVIINYFRSEVNSNDCPVVLQASEACDYKWINPYSDLDDYEFPFNMKDNIKQVLGIEKDNKAVIIKAMELGLIDPIKYAESKLEKAFYHKYISKKPDGKGGWIYTYQDEYGKEFHDTNANNSIDQVVNRLDAYTESIVDKYDDMEFKEHGRHFSKFTRKMVKLSLTSDMVNALGKYMEPSDEILDFSVSNSVKGNFKINLSINRGGKSYYISTDAIYAGGYNVQRLHYRYITDTNIPKKISPFVNEYEEKLKRLNKEQKIREEIKRLKGVIERINNEVQTKSKYSDEDILNSSEYWVKSVKGITWQTIVERGADKNFDYKEENFLNSQKKFEQQTIEGFKRGLLLQKENLKDVEKDLKKQQSKLGNEFDDLYKEESKEIIVKALEEGKVDIQKYIEILKAKQQSDTNTSPNEDNVKNDDIEIEKTEDKAHQEKIAKVMKEFAAGTLKDSHGKQVTDRKQALAIAYSYFEKGDDNIKKAIEEGLIGIEIFPILLKARSHKYIRKEWKDGKWEYIYEENEGTNTPSKEEIKDLNKKIKELKSDSESNVIKIKESKEKIQKDFIESGYRGSDKPKDSIIYKVSLNLFENGAIENNVYEIKEYLDKNSQINTSLFELESKKNRDKLSKQELDHVVYSALRDYSLFLQKVPENVGFREAVKKVGKEDYYIGTDVTFKTIDCEGKTPLEKFEELKKEGKLELSPKSDSKYIATDKGVYRLADHWGRCASCYWNLDSNIDQGNSGWDLAYADFSDFKINGNNAGYRVMNPDYEKDAPDLLKDSIHNLGLIKKSFKLTDNQSNIIDSKIEGYNLMLNRIKERGLSQGTDGNTDSEYIQSKKPSDVIQKAIDLGLIDEEKYIELMKAKPAQIGEIREWGGIKYQKTATNWFPVKSSPKSKKEDEQSQPKNKKQDEKGNEKQPSIEEHAKQASETALQNAVKQSPDPEVREAAHQELDRRQKEEHVQEEEKKDGREKKEANKHVEKFRQLSDDQIKFYLDAPYPEVKEAAKIVADERGLSVVSREDYIKSFEVLDTPKKQRDLYIEDQNKVKGFLNKNKDISISVSKYRGMDFKKVRDFLTDEESFLSNIEDDRVKVALKDKFSKQSDNLSVFINNNKIDKNLSLNRRVLTGNTFFHKLKEGDIYEDKSFSSASFKELDQFGDFNIKILVKKGSPVANLDNFNEMEYLIDKGAKFRVIEKRKDDLGITVELL